METKQKQKQKQKQNTNKTKTEAKTLKNLKEKKYSVIRTTGIETIGLYRPKVT